MGKQTFLLYCTIYYILDRVLCFNIQKSLLRYDKF